MIVALAGFFIVKPALLKYRQMKAADPSLVFDLKFAQNHIFDASPYRIGVECIHSCPKIEEENQQPYLSFNSQQWLDLGNPEVLNFRGPFTVVIRFRYLKATSYEPIFVAPQSYSFERYAKGGALALWQNDQLPRAFTKPIPLARWSNIAVVSDSKGLTLYLDGKLDSSSRLSYEFSPVLKSILIGHNPASEDSGRFFVGNLSILRVWQRALTPEEVLKQHNEQ